MIFKKKAGVMRVLFFAVTAIGVLASSWVWAQESRDCYRDEHLVIPWPEALARTPCEPELQARAGIACARIGQEGTLGAVFLTMHSGYALTADEAVQRHLTDSEQALADIPNVHVMQTRILSHNPLVATMEILRRDGALPAIPDLSTGPIRQTSFLYPFDDKLAQVFVYLPLDGDEAVAAYTQLSQVLPRAEIVSSRAPATDGTDQEGNAPEGVFALLPRALIFGAILAVLIIGGLAMARFWRARFRRQS